MPTIGHDKVTELRERLHSDSYRQRHGLLRAISGSTRLRILTLLHIHRPGLSMVDISRILHASLSRISHQMRILQAYDVIEKRESEGKTIYRLRFIELVRRLTR